MYATGVQPPEVILLDSTFREQERVYRAESADLVVYATMLVGPDDATDVVQDAFLRLFNNPTWRGNQVLNESAFLRTIVRSVANQHGRSAGRRRNRELRAWRSGQSEPHFVDQVDAVDQAPIHHILAELSARQAEVVRLTALDLKVGEIATEIGISEGAVRTYLKRSRPTIQRILDGEARKGRRP